MGDALAEGARAVLEGNWREGRYRGREYAFSVPSPRSYPWQWYWDSCFHAIVRRRFDPAGARRELETLLAASEDGFIGHTIFWARPVSFERSLRYNVRRRSDLCTRTIQPPLLAWAWGIVVGDPAAEPRIARHHDWLAHNRDLDGDGLLWIVQPDESGMDASPKFDHVWGRLAQGRPLFPLLIARNRRLGWDARRTAAAGRPLVCEVVTNVLWSLAQQALGRPSPTPALVERLWHERAGRFADDVRSPAAGPLAPGERPFTWDTLAPLVLPDLPEEIGRRLVEEVLLSPRFRDAVPIPGVALGDPAHSSKEHFWGLHRHWRGPSWVNCAWFVWLGLRRLGYAEHAERLTQKLASAMRASGFREYYDARSGRGMGAHSFGWSTLVWELLDPAPGSLASHL